MVTRFGWTGACLRLTSRVRIIAGTGCQQCYQVKQSLLLELLLLYFRKNLRNFEAHIFGWGDIHLKNIDRATYPRPKNKTAHKNKKQHICAISKDKCNLESRACNPIPSLVWCTQARSWMWRIYHSGWGEAWGAGGALRNNKHPNKYVLILWIKLLPLTTNLIP